MENPVGFELRLAAHQRQVERINAEGWKHRAPARPGRLRAALAATLLALAARLAPAVKAEAARAN
jgi:hypothetical protein